MPTHRAASLLLRLERLGTSQGQKAGQAETFSGLWQNIILLQINYSKPKVRQWETEEMKGSHKESPWRNSLLHPKQAKKHIGELETWVTWALTGSHHDGTTSFFPKRTKRKTKGDERSQREPSWQSKISLQSKPKGGIQLGVKEWQSESKRVSGKSRRNRTLFPNTWSWRLNGTVSWKLTTGNTHGRQMRGSVFSQRIMAHPNPLTEERISATKGTSGVAVWGKKIRQTGSLKSTSS